MIIYRASREEMLQTARSQQQGGDKSNLTGNVEPISQTTPPQQFSNIVWSHILHYTAGVV